MLVRGATADDWQAIWPIMRAVVRAADTIAYDPAMSEDEARATWFRSDPARRVTVAIDDAERVAGTAAMYPNQAGPGSHVASATYMVDAASRGAGVGRALVTESLEWARGQGFRAMQFNAVVETNVGAIALYRDLGFEIVGTIPGAFRHPTQGYVALHVMHLAL